MERFEVYLRAQNERRSGRFRGLYLVGDAMLVLAALWLGAQLGDRLAIERVVAPWPTPEPFAVPDMPRYRLRPPCGC